MEELTEQDKIILAKVMANMANQPIHELKLLAVTDTKTGETKIIKSHKVGDNPPTSEKIVEEKK